MSLSSDCCIQVMIGVLWMPVSFSKSMLLYFRGGSIFNWRWLSNGLCSWLFLRFMIFEKSSTSSGVSSRQSWISEISPRTYFLNALSSYEDPYSSIWDISWSSLFSYSMSFFLAFCNSFSPLPESLRELTFRFFSCDKLLLELLLWKFSDLLRNKWIRSKSNLLLILQLVFLPSVFLVCSMSFWVKMVPDGCLYSLGLFLLVVLKSCWDCSYWFNSRCSTCEFWPICLRPWLNFIWSSE